MLWHVSLISLAKSFQWVRMGLVRHLPRGQKCNEMQCRPRTFAQMTVRFTLKENMPRPRNRPRGPECADTAAAPPAPPRSGRRLPSASYGRCPPLSSFLRRPRKAFVACRSGSLMRSGTRPGLPSCGGPPREQRPRVLSQHGDGHKPGVGAHVAPHGVCNSSLCTLLSKAEPFQKGKRWLIDLPS